MDPGPGFLECRESLDRLALADDRLVIDQFLVDQHSCFFLGAASRPFGLPHWCSGSLNAGGGLDRLTREVERLWLY